MVTPRAARSLLNWTVGGLSVLDLAAAGLLSTYAVLLTGGLLDSRQPHAGIGPAIGVLAMTGPVAFRQRMPVIAAGVIAAGAAANVAIFGPMVRCGPALPAVFLVGYAVAACEHRSAAAGIALCTGNVVTQCAYDPRLGMPVIALMLPVLAAFFATGRLVRAWRLAADALRERSAQLRRQREQTARLAILADRVRVASDLNETLHAEIGAIAQTARESLDAADADPAHAREALARIERRGRETLTRLRELLSGYAEGAPSEPQPTLTELPALLDRATTAKTRLTIGGTRRPLPASLELSGYRIVEHLLTAMKDAPDATVDVGLHFAANALELRVAGLAARDVDLRAALGAACERAAMYGGTVTAERADGHYQALAQLPLVRGHA
jgi:signal transduction histidine kinase